jgi:hypothetical protein
VWDPPYITVTTLYGFGGRNSEANARTISPEGTRIAGSSGCCGHGGIGLIWEVIQ